MRKIYSFILPLFILLFWNAKSNAQVSTYVFSQSSGTYTENTDAGRVILGSATSDDQVFNNNTAGQTAPQTNTGFPIGFNFTYDGVVYDKFAVNNNGWIVVATGTFQIGASSGSNYTPLSSLGPVGVVNAIAGLGRDIQGQTGSELSYQTLGTAPNRVLVVQWKGYRRFAGTGQNYNFQIRLIETSNSIQVVFGSFTESSATSANPQVGLRGATNADFNNRTGLWAASIAGAVNTASMTLSTAAGGTPVSGLTYTWNEPPPCVAPPGGGTANGPAGTVCPGVNFNLTVSGASFGTGLTYLWESSPDNATWGPASGVNNAIGYTGNVVTNTYFRRRITCSAVDGYSSSVLVSVTGAAPIPLFENFASYATTFPPTCWTRNNTTYLAGFAPSAYAVGTGSARYQFYLAPSGTVLDLTTALFTAVPAGYFLSFDHAYATFVGEVDQLQILYSTNGGGSYTNLITYLGGSSGPLNTAGTTTAQLTAPTAAQWANKAIALPAGTNKLIFRGISAFGNNLFIDNINIASCLPPSGLGLSAISPTTATLSWTASISNPPGYVCEVRTSGAPGTGGVGYVTQDTVVAGVTSVITGLTPNTTYSYYVQSICGGGDVSTWAGAFVFTTPCLPIATPFTETFASTTFPPTCWTRNPATTTFLVRNAASAEGIGTGSAKYDFYNAASGTVLDLVTPLFDPTPASYSLIFDHAYATFVGEVDQLQIFYSTDGGGTYTNLITYLGGSTGPLNTAGATTAVFTPTADQWAYKVVSLPVGTNRLRFRGISAFGNNLFLDNINVGPTPTCLPVSNVNALGISPASVIVSFTPPPITPTVGYIVEYGAPGFTPGIDNTPGVGGTIVLGPGSPITVTGLTANTTYDFYVRKICVAGADFSINKKVTGTTLCAPVNIPYVQNFETSVPLVGFPNCTTMEDVNGNSGPTPNGGGGRWITNSVAQTYVSPTRSLWYIYDLGNPARGGDDWFYLQGLNLTAGTSYRVKAYYKGSDAPTWVENFEIKYGTVAHSSAMTNLIYTSPTTTTNAASPFDSLIADFTPAASGVYYIGFHAISAPDQAFLFIDDISVKISPVVDVGITGVALPSLNCPTNGVFVQATIRNYNTVVQNFATYPVTVTANIAGAGTGTLSALINSGTLAPGASMTIYLSPAFNFSAGGVYNINVATSSPDDPETGNDVYITSVNVNPNPATPVITPSSLQLCAGAIGQLSTQFAPSPPPVTLPAVSSGTIAVAVPDNSAAGASHTMNVNTVPAGATITGISVTINMTHTWIGDIGINLKAPNGNVLNLINQKGGSGDNLVNTMISSTSATPIPATGAPYTGTYAPDAANAVGATAFVSNVTAFSGLYSVGNGNWTLALRDHVGLDVGTLTSWSITITYQIITPTITWTPTAGLFTDAGATITYTGGNAFSQYVKPATTTTYTVTATTTAGCTASATALVTVNPIPVITIGSIPDTVCISDPSIPLAATPVGGSWSGTGVSGNNFIPPATAVGTYTLTYSYVSAAGCPATATKRIVVKDCPERMILLRDNAVILYPNPNSGRFNIRINSVLYNNLGMRVYSNNGTLVRTQQFGGLAWGRVIPIDLSHLPGGLYMIKFYYEGGPRTAEKTFKVIIGTE